MNLRAFFHNKTFAKLVAGVRANTIVGLFSSKYAENGSPYTVSVRVGTSEHITYQELR